MITTSKHRYEVEVSRQMLDVTSMRRPDTDWRFTDAAGHEHRWSSAEATLDSYNPSAHYEVLTLRWVFAHWAYWPDGGRYAIGHHECRQCGERIDPRYTSDDTRQQVPGITRWTLSIDGQRVAKDEMLAAVTADDEVPRDVVAKMTEAFHGKR